jgi:septin 7
MSRSRYRIVEIRSTADGRSYRYSNPGSQTPTLTTSSSHASMPPLLPSPTLLPTEDSDMDEFEYADWHIAATANGSAMAPPEKVASPADSMSSKLSSPFVERSNPMGGAGNAQTVSSKDPKAVAQAATDLRNVVRRKLTGYVGFANLPNQWHRKSVRKGFNFNVMVVGQYPYRSDADSLSLMCVVSFVSV